MSDDQKPRPSTRCQIAVEWTEEGPAVVVRRYNPASGKYDGEHQVLSKDPRDVILQGIADELYAIDQSLTVLSNRSS